MKTKKNNYSYIGKSVKKIDGFAKVTGEAKYVADISCPEALIIKLLRSSRGHAKIKKLNIKRAEALKGVVKVVTGQDCSRKTGTIIKDINVMAQSKVRYVGEVVAAVIAENENIATKALSLIEVEYVPLPVVTDVRAAVKKSAPVIHKEMPNNIYHHYRLRKGDIKKGFAKADFIFENKFSCPHVSHTALESHGCIALWNREGMLELTSSTQAPFIIKEFVAELLGVSQEKVRVKVPCVGGGFGGKSDMTIEPLIACLARLVPGRTVKLMLNREETFCGSLLGRGMAGTIKTGVKKDGIIVAEEITMYFNAGAYGDYCLPIVCGGGQNASGPYLNDNLKIDSYGVYTNTPYVGAFRGYGHPEGNWMKERQLDIIARNLNLDPIDLRLKNCWRTGKLNHLGQKIEGAAGKLADCIKKTCEEMDWDKKRVRKTSDKILSKAITVFMKSPVMATNGFSTSIIKFNSDASVNFSVGTIDIGQGSITVLSQICAHTLGIDLGKVHIARDTDTQFSAYEWQTVASRGTWSVGNAIVSACEDAIEKIKENAAYKLGVDSDKIIYSQGKVYVKGAKNKKFPLKDFVMGYTFEDGHTEGVPVVGYGAFVPSIQYPDPLTGQGRVVAEWTGGCQAVDIAVDRHTGEIDLRRLHTTIDAGTIVNPVLARGQIVGAMVQGLGQILFEKIIYDLDGKQRTHNFTDYKIPTPEDVWKTKMSVNFLNTPEENTPYGARCLGEHALVSLSAAVANALYNACGLEVFDLPVSCDTILQHLRKEGL